MLNQVVDVNACGFHAEAHFIRVGAGFSGFGRTGAAESAGAVGQKAMSETLFFEGFAQGIHLAPLHGFGDRIDHADAVVSLGKSSQLNGVENSKSLGVIPAEAGEFGGIGRAAIFIVEVAAARAAHTVEEGLVGFNFCRRQGGCAQEHLHLVFCCSVSEFDLHLCPPIFNSVRGERRQEKAAGVCQRLCAFISLREGTIEILRLSPPPRLGRTSRSG